MSIPIISDETWEKMRREYRTDKAFRGAEELSTKEEKKQILEEVAKAKKSQKTWNAYVKKYDIELEEQKTPPDLELEKEISLTWTNVGETKPIPIPRKGGRKGGRKTRKYKKSKKTKKTRKSKKSRK